MDKQNKPAARPTRPFVRKADPRKVALDVIRQVVRGDAFESLALSKSLRENTLSPVDRRMATELAYGTIERLIYIDYVLTQFLKRDPEDGYIRDVLRLAAYQILFLDRVPDHAACDEAVKQIKAGGRVPMAGLVNGVLRNLVRAKDEGAISMPDGRDAALLLSVRHSAPVPMVRRLISAYGQEMAGQILSYRHPASQITIRPNLLRMNAQGFSEYVKRRGWDARPGILPMAWHVRGGGELISDRDYFKGMYSIQGEASMLAALAVGAKPGMEVVDACAAPGGKSMLLCEMMGGAGRVYAWDVHEHRVALIRAAASRLGRENVRPAVRDASLFRQADALRMDAVLVDAPCTGLGVIADKPDIKLRYRDEGTDELVKIQSKILETCAGYVRPGGVLVYSTCTILPEENGEQVDAFLQNHPEFEPDTGNGWLPESLRGQFERGRIQLFAHQTGGEGFFIARMRRKDANGR